MYSKPIVGSALIALASLPVAFAGSCSVKNNCGYDVYLWSIADQFNVAMNTVSSGGSGYTEAYRVNPNGGGISVKISPTQDQSTITQLEYTLGSGLVYYDMSNINGAPFQAGGMTLAPTDSSCPTVNCPAGVVCTSAYINPDDVATKGCNSETDLVLTLCPGGAVASSGSSSSAAASAGTPTTLATSASPAPTATSASEEAATTESAQAPSVKYRAVAERDQRPARRVRHAHGHVHERQ